MRIGSARYSAMFSGVNPPEICKLIGLPPNNSRVACNNRKVPGHEAFYAANPGFTGRDRVVLEGSSPEGRVREITVDIEVR